MRTYLVVVAVGIVACSSSGGTGEVSSSGSSGTTSSSSGGADACTSRTCEPSLDAHFFDAAVVQTGKAFSAAPCPPAMVPKQKQPTGAVTFGAPQRFADEASFVAAFCDGSDAGTSGSTAIDFATSDLIALDYRAHSPIAPDLVLVGADSWVHRDAQQCGGVQPTSYYGFYIVPKGAKLNVESCTVVCIYGGACGSGPP